MNTQRELQNEAPRRNIPLLAIYSISLTVIVLGGLGWYVLQNVSTTTCPKPKTIRYSYDDARDYLAPFLSAVTSHDTGIIKRYLVPGITTEDRTSILQTADTYRGTNFEIGEYGNDYAKTDIGYDGTEHDTFTRLVWHTAKKEGCWRVKSVETKPMTAGIPETK